MRRDSVKVGRKILLHVSQVTFLQIASKELRLQVTCVIRVRLEILQTKLNLSPLNWEVR